MRRALVFAGVLPLAAVLSSETNAFADEPACKEPKTVCGGNSGYYASSDDLNRVTAVADPILRDVRTCLDSSGAKHVPAALVIRWDSDGHAVDVKIDVPGYESLACVQKAKTKLSALQNPHETAIRCEFGCPKPAPPPPLPAPAPITTPAPSTSPPPAPASSGAASSAVSSTAVPPLAPPPKRYEKVWYGYQTLIPDAITIPAFFGGVLSKTGGITAGGYLGFILVTPVIHMVHGNVGKGFGSMGIRLGGPPIAALFGAFAGIIINNDSNHIGDAAETGALVGAGIGAGICAVVDAFGFAYEKQLIDESPPASARSTKPAFTLSPTFGMNKAGGSVGVAGQF